MNLPSIKWSSAWIGFLAGLAGFVLAVPGTAGAGSLPNRACGAANTAAGGASAAQIRMAVICLVNQQRRERGLPPLREDPRLDRSAQGWTQTMVDGGQFTHGNDFAARITADGFHWADAGENIATGFSTPRAVVDAWMESLGHCRNILDPSYTRIGVGFVTRPVTGYASGSSTWTQDFGLLAGTRPPSFNTRPMDGCPYRVS